jgi:hypothetical protein
MAGEDPVGGIEELTSEAVSLEELYLGLRTRTGVQVAAADRPLIQPWLNAEWAVVNGGALRLTASGWLRIDALASALTDFRSRL